MGAWIETPYLQINNNLNESHPMWVRGLKRYICQDFKKHTLVAPHVGAWIETKSGKIITSF